MAASTIPETVAIPGEVAIEILAMLEALADLCSELADRGPDGLEEFLKVASSSGWQSLYGAISADASDEDDAPWITKTGDRRAELLRALRPLMGKSDASRLATLEEAVTSLGQQVCGVFWHDDQRRWMTPKAYFAALETTADAG